MTIYEQMKTMPLPAYKVVSRKNAEEIMSRIPENLPENHNRLNPEFCGAKGCFCSGYLQAYNVIYALLDGPTLDRAILLLELRAVELSDEYQAMINLFSDGTDSTEVKLAYQIGWDYARTKVEEILEKHIETPSTSMFFAEEHTPEEREAKLREILDTIGEKEKNT